jgi:hypothetical protein
MSGGHFDYADNRLIGIIEQLEQDVKYNNVPYDVNKDTYYGYEHDEETIEYIKCMIQDIQQLKDLLHSYDYAASGDSNIEEFKIKARKIYNNSHY